MNKSEMEKDGNDEVEVTNEQEDKLGTRTTEIETARRATKQEEKKKALQDRKENEREAEVRGCTEWIEADGTPFDRDLLLNKSIPVGMEQRQETVQAVMTPRINSDLTFGQSEFIVTSEESTKR